VTHLYFNQGWLRARSVGRAINFYIKERVFRAESELGFGYLHNSLGVGTAKVVAAELSLTFSDLVWHTRPRTKKFTEKLLAPDDFCVVTEIVEGRTVHTIRSSREKSPNRDSILLFVEGLGLIDSKETTGHVLSFHYNSVAIARGEVQTSCAVQLGLGQYIRFQSIGVVSQGNGKSQGRVRRQLHLKNEGNGAIVGHDLLDNGKAFRFKLHRS